MTNEEITSTLTTVTASLKKLTVSTEEMAGQQASTNNVLTQLAERQSGVDERVSRLEQILEKLSEKKFDTDETLKAVNDRLNLTEQILERLSEKQFHLDLKNEHIDRTLTRTSNLLMQAALNHAEGLKRLDRIEANMETLEAGFKIMEDKINHLSETVDRYIAFRMNGNNGNH